GRPPAGEATRRHPAVSVAHDRRDGGTAAGFAGVVVRLARRRAAGYGPRVAAPVSVGDDPADAVRVDAGNAGHDRLRKKSRIEWRHPRSEPEGQSLSRRLELKLACGRSLRKPNRLQA